MGRFCCSAKKLEKTSLRKGCLDWELEGKDMTQCYQRNRKWPYPIKEFSTRHDICRSKSVHWQQPGKSISFKGIRANMDGPERREESGPRKMISTCINIMVVNMKRSG